MDMWGSCGQCHAVAPRWRVIQQVGRQHRPCYTVPRSGTHLCTCPLVVTVLWLQAMIDAYARYGCSSECIFGVIGPRGWSQVHDKRGHRGHTGMTGCRRPGTEAYILNNSFHWMVILRVLHCPASGSWLWALHDPHPKTSRWAYVGDDVQLDAFIQAFIADGDRHTPVREHWAIPVSCAE